MREKGGECGTMVQGDMGDLTVRLLFCDSSSQG